MQKTILYSVALFAGLVVCIHGNAAVINSVVVEGDKLTMNGTALTGLAVTFDNQPTTVVSNNGTQIVVTLKTTPSQGNYRVTVGAGRAQVSAFVFVSDLKTERQEGIRFQCGADGVCNFIAGVPLAKNAELVLLREVLTNSGSYTVIGDGGNAKISLGGHTFTFSLNKGVLDLPNKETELCPGCGPFTLSAIVLRRATPLIIR